MKPTQTGHIIIDHHHEEVFALDQLMDTAIKTGDRTPILKIITFLNQYARDHFEMEETIMKRHHSNQLLHHQAEHNKLRKEIQELFNTSQTANSYTHLIFKTRKIIDQLIHHIQHVDIKLQELHHDEP